MNNQTNDKITVACIILCAGSSNRMGYNKLTAKLGTKTPIRLCTEAFLRCRHKLQYVYTASDSDTKEEIRNVCSKLRIDAVISKGGRTRAESVRNALDDIDKCDIVVIHDAARCLITPNLIDRSIDAALEHGSGIAALKVKDTLRNEHSHMCIDRAEYLQMQTPQTFAFEKIKAAYATCDIEQATDDCEIFFRGGNVPYYIEGSQLNQKLTYPEDMEMFSLMLNYQTVGYGEDTHTLAEGRRLILGGVDIPYSKGLLGHSDADVLTHSIIDALLGAAGLGDIGKHFPDTDDSYKGISSLKLLAKVVSLLDENGAKIVNVDSTIIAQKPKLAPYIDSMRSQLAQTLGIGVMFVSIKATTSEGMNDEGKMLCVSARTVAMINRNAGDSL